MIRSIKHYQGELLWILGHQSIKGNEKADDGVVSGLSFGETIVYNDIQTSFVAVANKTDDWALREITIKNYRILKMLWPHSWVSVECH